MSPTAKRRSAPPPRKSSKRQLEPTALDAVSGGVNVRDINVVLPRTELSPRGSIDAEQAGDLQAAQYLHREPSLDYVNYDARGPDNRFALGAYSRGTYNGDLANGNLLVRNGEVVNNREGSVSDRFSGLEGTPSFSTGPSPSDGSSFDERFESTGNSEYPSWMSQESTGNFTSSGFGSTPYSPPAARSISGDETSSGGDGNTYGGSSNAYEGPEYTQSYDDGSTFTQAAGGGHSSTPSTQGGDSD